MLLRWGRIRPRSPLGTGSFTGISCAWGRPDSGVPSPSWLHAAGSDRGATLDQPTGLSRWPRLAQLAPGPLAAQLAMYLGYVHAGIAGATIVSACFILPSFLMVWAISAAHVRFGGLPWMQ